MRWRRDRGAQQHAASASLGEIEGFHLAPDIDESARGAAKTRAAAAHTGSPALDTHSLHRIVGQGGSSHRLIRAVHWPTTRTRLRSRCGEQQRPNFCAGHRVRRGNGQSSESCPPAAVTRRPRGVSVWRLLREPHAASWLSSNLLAPEKRAEHSLTPFQPGTVCGQAPSLHGPKASAEGIGIRHLAKHVCSYACVPRLSADL
ncbi:hypothetical protein MTO96_020611 [Rhipicephalus appendiculatus]